MIKAVVHIDINTYEFVEINLEAPTYKELAEEIKKIQKSFHKLCEVVPEKKVF